VLYCHRVWTSWDSIVACCCLRLCLNVMTVCLQISPWRRCRGNHRLRTHQCRDGVYADDELRRSTRVRLCLPHHVMFRSFCSFHVKSFDAHCCQMGTAIKHPVPDRVKQSFVVFDIRALWRSGLSVRVPGCKNYKRRLNPVWHRMLYICTHLATVGVKGLKLMWCTQSECHTAGLKTSVIRTVKEFFYLCWWDPSILISFCPSRMLTISCCSVLCESADQELLMWVGVVAAAGWFDLVAQWVHTAAAISTETRKQSSQ